MICFPGRNGSVVIVPDDGPSVEVVRVGDDPFGRGEPTVFYRDYRINYGRDVFYMWVEHWSNSYPDIELPKVKGGKK